MNLQQSFILFYRSLRPVSHCKASFWSACVRVDSSREGHAQQAIARFTFHEEQKMLALLLRPLQQKQRFAFVHPPARIVMHVEPEAGMPDVRSRRECSG